jgi:hypothetical protein
MRCAVPPRGLVLQLNLAWQESDKLLAPVTPILVFFGDLQTHLTVNIAVLASKTLAGAKEGVYQVFMAQTAPQTWLEALPKVLGRLRTSWQKLVLPSLL